MRIRTIQIDDDMADVLRRASWPEPNLLRLPPGQLDRALYKRIDKLLQSRNASWTRKDQGFRFHTDAGPDDLRHDLERGHGVDRKRTLELFETPVPIAKRMARIGLHGTHTGSKRMLEPSAGTGRLLAALRAMAGEGEPIRVTAIDIDARNCDVLRQQGIADEIHLADFLDLVPTSTTEQPDVILMNPPFANTADILHVTHAYRRWLAPGGVLVAIMSAHWTFSQDKASRDFSSLMHAVEFSMQPLPDNAFRAEGAGVRTVLISMRKPAL